MLYIHLWRKQNGFTMVKKIYKLLSPSPFKNPRSFLMPHTLFAWVSLSIKKIKKRHFFFIPIIKAPDAFLVLWNKVFHMGSQHFFTPTKSKQSLKLILGTVFVNMSVWLSVVWTFIIAFFPSSTASLIKWYMPLMCIVLSWYILDKWMTLWVSLNRVILSCLNPVSPTKSVNHILSFISFVDAVYSSSVVDNATVLYKIYLQLIVLPHYVKV